MPNAPHTKTSRDLANIQRQLKSGKTRSNNNNPRDLKPEEITALEQRRAALVALKREAATKRLINRVNSHTTREADRVIASQVPTHESVAAIAAIIVEGKAPPRVEGQSAQERLAQIRQQKSRLTTEAEHLREARKNERVQAAEDRENRMSEVKRKRTDRINAKRGTASAPSRVGPSDVPPVPEESSRCTATLKGGKHKGSPCGAKMPCKRHKQAIGANTSAEPDLVVEPAVDVATSTAAVEEPVVEAEEPAVEAEEPAVEVEESAVEAEEPAVEVEEPCKRHTHTPQNESGGASTFDAGMSIARDSETIGQLPDDVLRTICERLNLDYADSSKSELVNIIVDKGGCGTKGCNNVAINICQYCRDRICGESRCWMHGTCETCVKYRALHSGNDDQL